jgi:hypothetical protein
MVNKKQVLISRPLKQDIPGDYCGAERPEEKDHGTTRQEVSLRQKTIPAQECVVLLVAVFFCSCLFLRCLCGAVRYYHCCVRPHSSARGRRRRRRCCCHRLFAFLGSTTIHAFAILSDIIWESFWSGSALPSRLLLKEKHETCCLLRLVEVVREGWRRLGGSSTSCEPSFLSAVFFCFCFLVLSHFKTHSRFGHRFGLRLVFVQVFKSLLLLFFLSQHSTTCAKKERGKGRFFVAWRIRGGKRQKRGVKGAVSGSVSR